jgi:hypothetical protein
MTPNSKRDRIDQLWGVARKQIYKKQVFIGAARNVVSKKAQEDIAGAEINNTTFKAEKQKSQLPFYLIDPTNIYLRWWIFFIDLVTIYFIFITPVFIVFSDYMTTKVRVVEFCLDILYLIDIIRCFFTAEHGEKVLYKIFLLKLYSPLIVDLATTIPALVTFESYKTQFPKLFRISHIGSLTKPIDFFSQLILKKRGINKQRLQDLSDSFKLVVFTVTCAHILACLWLYIGRHDVENGWVYNTDNNFRVNADGHLYIASFYFTIVTLTTVGYGDYSGNTTKEYIFSMILEFLGLTFFSILMV